MFCFSAFISLYKCSISSVFRSLYIFFLFFPYIFFFFSFPFSNNLAVVNSSSLDDEELLLRNTYINSLPTDFLDTDDILWNNCECSFDNVAINFYDKVDSASPTKGHPRKQKKNRRLHKPRSCEVPNIISGPSVKWKDEGDPCKHLHQNVAGDAKDAKESMCSSSKLLNRTLKAVAAGCETGGLEVGEIGEIALADLKTSHVSVSPENVIQLQRSIEQQLQYLGWPLDVDQSAITTDSNCPTDFIPHKQRRQHGGSNTNGQSVDKKRRALTPQSRNNSSSGDSNSPAASDSRRKAGKQLDVGATIVGDDGAAFEGVEREIGKAEVQNSRLAGSVPIGKKKLQSPVDVSKRSAYSSEGGVDVAAAKVNSISGVEEKVGGLERKSTTENVVVDGGGAKKYIFGGEKNFCKKVVGSAPGISVATSDSCKNCSSCENTTVAMVGSDRLYDHGGCEKTDQILGEVEACRISSPDRLKTYKHNAKKKGSRHYVKRRRRGQRLAPYTSLCFGRHFMPTNTQPVGRRMLFCNWLADPSKRTRGQCESGDEEVFEGNYLLGNRMQNSETDNCHLLQMTADSSPIGRLGAAKVDKHRTGKLAGAKKRHASLNATHVSPRRSSHRTHNKHRHLKQPRKQAEVGSELGHSWHEFAESGGGAAELVGIYYNDIGRSNSENINMQVFHNVDDQPCGGVTANTLYNANGPESFVTVAGTKPTIGHRHTTPTKKSVVSLSPQAAGLCSNGSPRNAGLKNGSPLPRSPATPYVTNHTNIQNCGPLSLLKPPNVSQMRVCGLPRDKSDAYLPQSDFSQAAQGPPKGRQMKNLTRSDSSFSRFNSISNGDSSKTCNGIENDGSDLSHSYSTSFLHTLESRPLSLEMKAAVKHVVTTLSVADQCDVDEGCGPLKPHVATSPSLLYSRYFYVLVEWLTRIELDLA